MLGVGSRFKRSAGARRTHQVLRLGCFGAAAVVLAVFSLLSASDDGSHGGVLSGGGASSTTRRRLTEEGSLYPDDAFGKEGMKKGAIMLHIIGVTQEEKVTTGRYMCPVYTTTIRGPTFIFVAPLKTDVAMHKWILAAVCLLMQPDS